MKASSNQTRRKNGVVGKIILYVIIFLVLLLTFSYHWSTQEFGAITFAEIIFTLNMPLQGTSSTFIQSYLLRALLQYFHSIQAIRAAEVTTSTLPLGTE